MALYLGFDPGGAGAFGWSLLSGDRRPLELIARAVCNHAHQAVDEALVAAAEDKVVAVGIDAPLFWRAQGDRIVDQVVRNAIVQRGANGGTVNAVNSMRGACLVQGMMAAMLIRARQQDVPITEAHPKALLWLLGIARPGNPTAAIALGGLQEWVVARNLVHASDHERDAALGAVSAFAMHQQMNGWQDLFLQEPSSISPLNPRPSYWLPIC